MRRDALQALARRGKRGGLRTASLRRLLEDVRALLRDGRAAATTAARESVRASWTVGASAVAGTPVGALGGTSKAVLGALVRTTTQQVTQVWSELGPSLARSIRRVVSGVDDPFTAMREVARVIRRPSTFGTAFNRAEAVVRTEVNRTFASASNDRAKEAGKAGVRLRKWWLTARDARVRHTHVEAGKRYPKSKAIPMDQPFRVGNADLMFPTDPSGPPEETINCRCVVVYEVEP